MEAPGGESKARDLGTMLPAGSRTLAQALPAADLVDELHLRVFPLLLDNGRLATSMLPAIETESRCEAAREWGRAPVLSLTDGIVPEGLACG